MNLVVEKIDKLEQLPKTEKLERNQRYRNGHLPWGRLNRWIKSKVGQNSDTVFSQFVLLPWLPAEFRNLDTYKRLLETNTLLQDREVFYYSQHSQFHFTELEGHIRPIHELARFKYRPALYVHPTTKIISVAPKKEEPRAPRKPDSYNMGNVHLQKIGGIWYKTITKQLKGKELKKLGLENDPIDSSLSRRELSRIY